MRLMLSTFSSWSHLALTRSLYQLIGAIIPTRGSVVELDVVGAPLSCYRSKLHTAVLLLDAAGEFCRGVSQYGPCLTTLVTPGTFEPI